MYEMIDIIKLIARFADVIQFGILFVWITGWYILYQMTRLRFLKLRIIGDVFYAVYWVLHNSHYFTGNVTHTVNVVLVFTNYALYILAVGSVAVGACSGLRYLQKKWNGSRQDSAVAQNQK